MGKKRNINCAMCGRQARLMSGEQPGYREPDIFEIVHCDFCGTAYAMPPMIDNGLYEFIYLNSHRLPGYMRYAGYSKRVLSEPDPLAYLASAEDVYWAIGKHLEDVPREARILEVGCGLGYLTYAISRRGYRATGMDISRKAIEEASRNYGNMYLCADLIELSSHATCSYDVIIMTEVIEHLPDPVGFIRAAQMLLRKGGYIIVTTPNRSIYHDSVLWQTETPPVHLWWFSEKSLLYMGNRMGFEVCFTAFKEYSTLHPIRRRCELSLSLPTRGPVLKANGNLVNEDEERKIIFRFQKNFLKKALFKIVNQFVRAKDMTRGGSRRSVICAKFTPSPEIQKRQ